MDASFLDFDYRTWRTQGTGNLDYEVGKTVDVKFDRYVIKIRLSPSNEFMGIEEISVDKDFLSNQQKLVSMATTGYHDVEQYYQEEAAG
jgi:hypothetical protein